MDKTWIKVSVTHHGDDWEDSFCEVFCTEQEANNFKVSHTADMKNVAGVEHVEFNMSEKTEKQLRNTLTVRQYCDLFPEVKVILDNLHK